MKQRRSKVSTTNSTWRLLLSPEAQHLVKIADIDALEQVARTAGDLRKIASTFENIFEALDSRSDENTEKILDWSQRYVRWANEYREGEEGLPIARTEWAKRSLEICLATGRRTTATEIIDAILSSYAPLDKERTWWARQHSDLSRLP